MKIYLLFVMILFVSCYERESNSSKGNLSLQEIGNKIQGRWRIIEIETKERKWTPISSRYTVEYFEFNGLTGTNGRIIYNKDGSIETKVHQPAIELKVENGKNAIEFIGLSDWTVMEVIDLSIDTMILVDSTYTVTYLRDKN